MSAARRMPPPARIAVGQMNPQPGAVDANLAQIEEIVRGAARAGAQLVVLPETATTGYFINDRLKDLAEPEDGPQRRPHCGSGAGLRHPCRGGHGDRRGRQLPRCAAAVRP